jgi:MoaA/NifB/PqqE/SkfB family radical SAM enzyme
MYEWMNVNFDLGSCSLACKHCYFGYRKGVRKRTFSHDEIAKLIEELASLIHGDAAVVRNSISVAFFPETTCIPQYLQLVKLVENGGLAWFENRAPMSTGAVPFIHGSNIEEYLLYRKAHGNDRVQLTLHGLEQHHDGFVGRPGSYRACLDAARRFYDYGCRIEWMLFLYKSNLEHLGKLKECIARISPQGRYTIQITIPTYIENAMDIDDIRLETDDLEKISEEDSSLILKGIKSEAEYVRDAMSGKDLAFWISMEHPEITISADGTIARSNYAYEPIGSLHSKTLREIVFGYRDKTSREEIMYSTPHAELATKYGDPHSRRIYHPYGMWIKWMTRHLSEHHMPIIRRRDYLS